MPAVAEGERRAEHDRKERNGDCGYAETLDPLGLQGRNLSRVGKVHNAVQRPTFVLRFSNFCLMVGKL